jgi:hypothetical protein
MSMEAAGGSWTAIGLCLMALLWALKFCEMPVIGPTGGLLWGFGTERFLGGVVDRDLPVNRFCLGGKVLATDVARFCEPAGLVRS